MLDALPPAVNGNANLVRRGRYLTATFLLGVGGDEWLIEIERGRIAAIRKGPLVMASWRFAIRMTEKAWREFTEPVPRPGYHDIFAMTKSGEAAIKGDLRPFMANLRYFKEILAALRRAPES